MNLPAELVASAAEGSEARRRLVQTLLANSPEPFLEHQRGPLLASFHLDNVPREVLDADMELTDTVVPRLAAAQATVPGIARDAAPVIDVPAFLAFGEVDVSPSPLREPATYPASRDVTLFLLGSSAHCHNVATTRTLLWDRLEAWATSVVGGGSSRQ